MSTFNSTQVNLETELLALVHFALRDYEEIQELVGGYKQ
jgi:hypothetical protein